MSSLAVIRQSATIQTSLVGIMTMQYLKHEIQATHYTTPERSVTLQLSTYFMSKSRTANSICFAILYLHYCYRSTVPDSSFSRNYRQFRILTRILRMQPSCSTCRLKHPLPKCLPCSTGFSYVSKAHIRSALDCATHVCISGLLIFRIYDS